MGTLVALAGKLRGSTPEEAVELERSRLRDVAAEGRRLLARNNVTWVSPGWASGKTLPAPNGVHVTASSHGEAIGAACGTRGLEILPIPPGRELAEARFDSLRRSAVVVVDIGIEATARAAACYEAGIALVLGKPVVVIAGADPLPFDVDVEPVRTGAGRLDVEAFGLALDRALIEPQRASSPGNLSDLATAARERFVAQATLVNELERCLDQPLKAAAALENIVRDYDSRSGQSSLVAYPAWPRLYPRLGERRLFHVMPFGGGWPDDVKRRVAEVCRGTHSATYRRHDDVSDPRIIRSLWDELSMASHVLVDLTDLNANVAVELGVADTLGKNILCVGQPGTVRSLFPMIKGVRVVEYTLAGTGLESIVGNWLGRTA
jgi:hypothetical protein